MACVSTLYTTRQFIGVLSAARLRRVYDQRGACFDRPPDSSSAAADFCAINRRISRPTNAASRLPVSALNSAAVFHWLIAYKSLLSGPGRLPVRAYDPGGQESIVIRAFVCSFVCPLAHFKNHISKSRNFLQYACCLRPWLGPGHIVSSRPYSGAVAIRYV